jgi:Mn-containing catalase
MPDIQELLVEEMQDLLHAEGQLVKALPKMAKAAKTPDLKQAFQEHLEQTKGHVERLNRAFELLGAKPKSKPCKGMEGLVEEGSAMIEEGKEKPDSIADLALIAAAQKVEHYEISGYGTLRALAEHLGNESVAKLLGQTLAEEEKADKLLTNISPSLMNSSESKEEDDLENTKAKSKTAAHR